MVCGTGDGSCEACELRKALTFALSHGKSGAAFELVESLLDAVEAVRDCYGGADQETAAATSAILVGLWSDLRAAAGLGAEA